uniref:32.8 kDa salivary protein n=1 Tax=Phlebotomus duboscqi TaxID=37738 RepID=Q06K39_PHLDU|nr:32.8 kDa salivary protein [Phlebotomus duboscqi]
MLRHIFSVGLFVVVAHCAQLPGSANSIPIKNQGKDFPVPFVSEQTDDFYDDKFYPDIDDENINEVVRDNKGNRGAQSNVPAGGSRPSATPTSGGRPSQPPSRGETRPSVTPSRDRRPSQSSRREPCASGSPTRGRTPSQSPEGEPRPSATFPSSSDRESLPFPRGQFPIPDTFPTKGVESLPNSGGVSRPSVTLPGSDRTQWGGYETSRGQNSRQQGRRQDRKQPDLSKYKNSPAKYIFATGNVDSGKEPDEVRMFRTKRPEYELATGDPYNNYLVEIIEGPNPSDISLKQSTVMGGDSKIILENPTGRTIVGRIKTYKGEKKGN